MCTDCANRRPTENSIYTDVPDRGIEKTETESASNIQIKEAAPQKETPKKPGPKVYHVTGISHYEDNLMNLAMEDDDFCMTKKDLVDAGRVGERIWKYFFSVSKAEIIPEPDNPVDPKAIKVVADGMHVGYIKAGACSHLLKVLREDRIKKIKCEIGGGPYRYISEKYDDYKDKFVYTVEKGTAPYYVHLSITEE